MSPLSRRLPRELVRNAGKYLGLFALLVLTVSIAAGALVVERSTIAAIAEQRAVANMEDFSFTTQSRLTQGQLAAVQAVGSGVTVYENFQIEPKGTVQGEPGEKDFRLYQVRTQFNLPTYDQGGDPEGPGQIALDRSFCNAHGISVGDVVTVAGRELTVCGIMVLPDYQALLRSNTSLMYDTATFTVGLVTPEAFEELGGGIVTYRYAALLSDRQMGLVDRTAYEKDFATALADEGATLTDLLDKETMQSRTYADSDLEQDQSIWIALSAILITVAAFVFVVLTDATIEREGAMIGTLLASGYRKSELVRHYLVLPTLVGLAAAAVGNALGYTVVADTLKSVYYLHYSLPPYRALFYPDLFVGTTVLPLALLVLITGVGVARKLKASPLAFLRGEVGHRSRRSSMPLLEAWPFVQRFRTRVFLRNLSHFVVLFVGIAVSLLLIVFGTCLLPLFEHYANETSASLPARHLYLLKAPVEIEVDERFEDAADAFDRLLSYDDPAAELPAEEYRRLALTASGLVADPRVLAGHPLNTRPNSEESIDQAEKVAATTLDVRRLYDDSDEEATVYGIEVGSRYWSMDVSGGKIVVGRGLAEKCGLAVGREATFTNRFTGKAYTIVPDAIAGSSADMGVYMSRSTWAELFASDEADGDTGYFNAYASDEPLDLTARYLASVRTPDEMAAIAEQMSGSFGSMMTLVVVAAMGVSITLTYLLTKTAIDRSERYISYMKVFGYHSREVNYLYLRPITYTVVASYVLSVPLVLWTLDATVRVMMARYGGNFELWLEWPTLVRAVAIGVASYLVVATFHIWRVRRISMTEAMKVQE